MGEEKLDAEATDRLASLLQLGDPNAEVAMAYRIKERLRDFYRTSNPDEARRILDEMKTHCLKRAMPPEVRKLGRTLKTWFDKICNYHLAKVTNGPTESLNNLIKRIKRIASDSAISRTIGSGLCSTPADRTGESSARSSSDEARPRQNPKSLFTCTFAGPAADDDLPLGPACTQRALADREEAQMGVAVDGTLNRRTLDNCLRPTSSRSASAKLDLRGAKSFDPFDLVGLACCTRR